MLAKIFFIFGFIVLSSTRSIHRYELGDRYYYLKALKQQERENAQRFPHYYRPADDYNFGYSVDDQYTGDIKSQKEERRGGVVKGSYELLDSDGYKRIVDYTADDVHGFNAFVRRVPFGGAVGGQFGRPFAPATPVFSTPTPFSPTISPVHTTRQFGSYGSKVYPVASNNLNDYVSDFFSGYSEGSFDRYY